MKSFKQTLKEDIQPGYAPDEVTFGGYTTKNLHHSEDAVKAFMSTIDKVNKGEIKDSEGVLHALKATDTYMKLNDMHLEQGKAPDEAEVEQWKAAHDEARRHLHAIGEFMHHMDYWHMHEHELQDELTAYNPETAGAEMADSYEPQGNMVEAASPAARFNQKVKQAQAAHEAGDHKKAKYHLDTARNFMLGINSNDHGKIKDSYPKYKELRDLHKEEVNLDEEADHPSADQVSRDLKARYGEAHYKSKATGSTHRVTHDGKYYRSGMMRSASVSGLLNGIDKKVNNKAPATGVMKFEEFELNEDLTSKTIRPTDKVKVARVIANMLDVENVESMSPETAINLGLRKIRHKRMTPELITVLTKMLNLAQMVGVKVDMNLLPHAMKQEKQEPIAEVTQSSGWPNKGENETDILRLKDYIALDRAAHGQVGHSMHSSAGGEDKKDHVRRMKVKFKTEDVELDEMTQGKEYTQAQLQKKIQSGNWEATHDMKPGKHVEMRHTSGKKVMVQVKEAEDVEVSADYKTDKRGRKHPAHEIVFRDGGEDGSDKKDVKEELDDAKDVTKKAALTLRHAREKESMAARHEVQKKSVTEEADGLDDSEAEILNLSDDEVDNFVTYDNLLDVLDDDEVDYIDLDTGEPIEDDESVNEAALNEVLSRTERMKAKVRFMRTQSKRERRVAIALKRRSDAKTINKRSRRLAIKLIKQKLIKKPVADMSVAEKERVERMIHQRKAMIDRLAMRMAPKVRRMETDRLGGHKSAAPRVGV